MRIVLLLTAVLVYSVAFAQESDDSANDDTRAMCIAVLLPALVATNQVEPDYNLAASNLMIQAHTIRSTGLNCFMNLEGNLYHVFVSFGESYCQIWCMPRKSSGDLVGLFDLFSVNKCHAFNDLCQVFEAA